MKRNYNNNEESSKNKPKSCSENTFSQEKQDSLDSQDYNSFNRYTRTPLKTNDNSQHLETKISNHKDLLSATMTSHSPNIAALDLGTNSCRLLIASVGITSLHRNFFKIRTAENRRFQVIDSFARIVSLGEGLKQTGVLSENAIKRTLDALQICQKKIKMHHVCRLRAIATEACRKASNTNVLLERAKNEIGISIEVISPREEAYLVLKGCASVLSNDKNHGIVLDIGGGSTEVIWFSISKRNPSSHPNISIIDSISLPFGVVTLTDSYTSNSEQFDIFSSARQSIIQSIRFFILKNNIQKHLDEGEVQIVTSSGTATTLGSLALGLPKYNRRIIDGKDFSSQQLKDVGEKVMEQFLHFPPEEKSINRKASPIQTFDEAPEIVSGHTFTSGSYYRLGLLASGAVILRAILDTIGPFSLRIADRGVREGILYDLIDTLRTRQSMSWNTHKKNPNNASGHTIV